MIETNITARWENGIDHHPRSDELVRKIAEIDFKYGSDFFGFKIGGDGDNGEHLMYLLDIVFEQEELRQQYEEIVRLNLMILANKNNVTLEEFINKGASAEHIDGKATQVCRDWVELCRGLSISLNIAPADVADLAWSLIQKLEKTPSLEKFRS